MLRSIATVSISGTLPEKLHAIAAAGYQGVEIFENDLLYYTGTPAEIRQLAADLGLKITLFQPFRDFEGASRAQFAANMARARRKFALMRELGCETLLLCRFGLGISEAPCFPVNSRVVSAWFPQQERAKATAVYTVGEYLGLACFAPLLFWIMDGFGWRVLFVSVGAVGILFALVWWRCYREPHEDPRLSQQEREHIENGGGLSAPTDQQVAFSWPLVRQLLSKRQIIGASIGQFAGNTVLVFFLTWFPTWLATERHMPWLKVGFFSILPFVAAAGGVMFGGWLSDKLLKATGSANLGRKLPIVAGLLMASCIITANWLESDLAVILVMSFAFFGQGMVGLGWTLISDIAPKGLGGLTGGLFNFCANLAGILTPLVIGFIVAGFGNFFYALIYIGGAALLGVVAYLFILGDVKRIELSQ